MRIGSLHGGATMKDGPDGLVLNPWFAEALMGFPTGWTAYTRSETLSFLESLK